MILGAEGVVDKAEIDHILAPKEEHRSGLDDEIFQLPLKLARLEFEKIYLQKQLKTFDGNVAQMSKHIEIERTHLYRKLRSLDVDLKKSKKGPDQ